jgi:acyl-CoA dehydrogenase
LVDFDDSAEDAVFRAELRAWLQANATARVQDPLESMRVYDLPRDESAAIADQQRWQRKLYADGWGAITWPAEYGGRQASPTQSLIFREELSRYEIPNLSVFLIGHGMIGPTIIAHGTSEQRDRYIRPLAEGREIWCQLWSEPNAGSDLASVQTRALRDHATDGWRLQGQKVWTTFAHAARWGLCLTRTNTDLPKHRGLSVFIVDMTAPGVTVRPLRQLNGGSEFNEVFLDDVPLPADSLVGDLDDGWNVAITTLMNERYAGGLMGDLTGLVRPLVALAQQAPASYGSFESAAVRQELARLFVSAKLITLTGYRSQSQAARSGRPGPEGSILKLAFADLNAKVGSAAMRILGLPALRQDEAARDAGIWPSAYLTTQASRIAGGTDDIQRNIVAERILKLPRDPIAPSGASVRDSET